MSKDDKVKSPAYQWYCKDIMGSQRVALMSLQEEGAYRRALDFSWLHGSLPNDANKVAIIIGKRCTKKIAEVVITMYKPVDGNNSILINERQEVERVKQANWRKKSKEGGKKSAKLRATKPPATEQPKSNHHSILVEEKEQPTGNITIASTITTTTNIKKIKVGEVWFDFSPSEFLTKNYKMWLDVKMTTMFTGIAPAVILKKLDEKYSGDTFNDDEHVKNVFKKIGEGVRDAKQPTYHRNAETNETKSQSQNIAW